MAESGCKTVKEVEDGADRLLALVTEPSDRDSNDFVAGIESSCDTVLVRLLARLPAHEVTPGSIDAVRATLDLRMSERQVAVMKRLEASTTRLSVVAIVCTIVLGLVGLVVGI